MSHGYEKDNATNHKVFPTLQPLWSYVECHSDVHWNNQDGDAQMEKQKATQSPGGYHLGLPTARQIVFPLPFTWLTVKGSHILQPGSNVIISFPPSIRHLLILPQTPLFQLWTLPFWWRAGQRRSEKAELCLEICIELMEFAILIDTIW